MSALKKLQPSHLMQCKIAALGSITMTLFLLFRIFYTGEDKYLYLVWNVILAWVAWALGVWFLYLVRTKTQLWKKWVLFIGWLVFLPNTYYILSDMVHPVLNYDKIPGFHGANFGMVPEGTMILFDISLVGLAVWVGWYLGVVSLLDVRRYLSSRFGGFRANVLTQLIIAASAFAIYLGRTPRLNTWDILVRPLYVVQTALTPLLHPVRESDAFAMTILFTVLISVIFWSCVLYVDKKV